jgi:hypothetical protein
VTSIALDVGALIAIERGDRSVLALCKVASDEGGLFVVPAGVVEHVWRDGSRQVPIARVVKSRDTRIEPIDLDVAKLAGSYCGVAGTSADTVGDGQRARPGQVRPAGPGRGSCRVIGRLREFFEGLSRIGP